MGRRIFRGILGLLIAVAVVYVGDWAVWRARVASGGGTGSVVVKRMIVASLKGNKEEYYADGSDTVACSKSLFPQTGAGACWWVEDHREVTVRY